MGYAIIRKNNVEFPSDKENCTRCQSQKGRCQAAQGFIEVRKGNFKEAFALFSSAMLSCTEKNMEEVGMARWSVKFELGKSAFLEGQHEYAAGLLMEAVAINPRLYLAHIYLSKIYAELAVKRNSREFANLAIAAINEAVALGADKRRLGEEAGDAYCVKGQSCTAVEWYGLAVELGGSKKAHASRKIAEICLKSKNPKKALEAWSAAEEVVDSKAFWNYKMAVILNACKKFGKAIKHIELAREYGYDNFRNLNCELERAEHGLQKRRERAGRRNERRAG